MWILELDERENVIFRQKGKIKMRKEARGAKERETERERQRDRDRERDTSKQVDEVLFLYGIHFRFLIQIRK